ncbi:hypothetical protein [Corallococcus sp. 4LFB]|uniref:hypothetical protein n=1 Tax=Corallococcus sp. 4LFB TaxID=3383249 RepID=UPI003976F645
MRDAALVVAAVALFAAYVACVAAFWWRVWRRRPQPESTPAALRLRHVVDNTRCTRRLP